MRKYIILRQELAANAVDAITRLYGDKLATLQSLLQKDPSVMQQISWAALTPDWEYVTGGMPMGPRAQRITLELQARYDILSPDLRLQFQQILEVFEDFFARADLRDYLSTAEAEGVTVQSTTPENGNEAIEGDSFVTSYKVRCLVVGK